MNKYFDTKSCRVVTAEEVKASNPEAITTKRDNLSYCLMAGGYGELRY